MWLFKSGSSDDGEASTITKEITHQINELPCEKDDMIVRWEDR